jgi:hypothetical protein
MIIAILPSVKRSEIHLRKVPVGTLRRNGTLWNRLAPEIHGELDGVATRIHPERV